MVSQLPAIPAPVAARTAEFVERFADALVAAGMPRMASRVFAAVLCVDAGRATVSELSAMLMASPAAISGAVRYLEQVDLVRRSRDPGDRRDVYSVGDDVWYESLAHREGMLALWERTMADGVAALGLDSTAGRRMAETQAFFTFWREELPGVLERWASRRDALREAWPQPAGRAPSTD